MKIATEGARVAIAEQAMAMTAPHIISVPKSRPCLRYKTSAIQPEWTQGHPVGVKRFVLSLWYRYGSR